MKFLKNLFWRETKTEKSNVMDEEKIKYIHPHQIDGVVENLDEIIQQLNAAIVIAGKAKRNSCEVGQFKMYKKIFHELWLGVAEYYNYINSIDVESNSDEKYIA